MPHRLQDKVTLITGAGAGLGRESAVLFADEGASVVVTDVDGGRAEETAGLVREAGGRAMALKTDVAIEADVAAAVDAAVAEYGRLDVLYANAGIPARGFGTIPFED